jgi:hypothetical protein
MRQEVDATELDDVYLEQTDEEFVETPAGLSPSPDSAEVSSVVTTTVVSEGTPPATA